MKARRQVRQQGVAVITALLLTTLAITIVASLFWQQQVQVRSIENQRLQLQKQWILRGALDWTRLILREDLRIDRRRGPGATVDHLGEPWAVPLAETRLDQYVENAQAGGDVPDAALSGGIIDAQSRFNLSNLCRDGQVKEREVAAFARLLSNARLNPSLAQATANLMKAAQAKPDGQNNQRAAEPASARPLDILQVDDLLAVPDFTPEALAAIRDFIVVLPEATKINVNTAPAEVLAARIATLSLSDAAALVARRENAWFNNLNEFENQLPAKSAGPDKEQLEVSTKYFLVNGNVRLNRAGMQMQSLIHRSGDGPNLTTKVVWIRES